MAQKEKIYMYGKNALVEALENVPHILQKVFVADGALPLAVTHRLREAGITVSRLNERDERNISKDAAHQGVIGVIDPSLLMKDFAEFMRALDISKNPSLVLLDELQDPHNVGAIIRSAAAFGVSGILMPQNHQVQVTGAVVKTSAGMTFRVPLVSIGNVNMTLRQLKEAGFWIYGLSMEGGVEAGGERFNVPAVFVIGNEGEGIRQKTLEHCDVTLSIPIHPRTESLNAAVSAAIVMYEWSKQHKEALQ